MPVSSNRNARGVAHSSPLAYVTVFNGAPVRGCTMAVADADTEGKFPLCFNRVWVPNEGCEIRPVCQSWVTIFPPFACTAFVTDRQAATCTCSSVQTRRFRLCVCYRPQPNLATASVASRFVPCFSIDQITCSAGPAPCKRACATQSEPPPSHDQGTKL